MKRKVTDSQRRVMVAIDACWKEQVAPEGAVLAERSGLTRPSVYSATHALKIKGYVRLEGHPALTAAGESAIKEVNA